MDINELIQRYERRDNTEDDWLQLEKDMHQFLDEDHPLEEKRKLVPLGCLETVTIMCDGIKRKRGI